jgi:hypothetical protein
MQIYLIRANEINLYKIGISKNANNRIKQLQTGCPYQLEIVQIFEPKKFPYKVEKIMHRSMSIYKQNEDLTKLKGEWFDLKNNEIQNFVSNCKKAEDTLICLFESGNHFIRE